MQKERKRMKKEFSIVTNRQQLPERSVITMHCKHALIQVKKSSPGGEEWAAGLEESRVHVKQVGSP